MSVILSYGLTFGAWQYIGANIWFQRGVVATFTALRDGTWLCTGQGPSHMRVFICFILGWMSVVIMTCSNGFTLTIVIAGCFLVYNSSNERYLCAMLSVLTCNLTLLLVLSNMINLTTTGIPYWKYHKSFRYDLPIDLIHVPIIVSKTNRSFNVKLPMHTKFNPPIGVIENDRWHYAPT